MNVIWRPWAHARSSRTSCNRVPRSYSSQVCASALQIDISPPNGDHFTPDATPVRSWCGAAVSVNPAINETRHCRVCQAMACRMLGLRPLWCSKLGRWLGTEMTCSANDDYPTQLEAPDLGHVDFLASTYVKNSPFYGAQFTGDALMVLRSLLRSLRCSQTDLCAQGAVFLRFAQRRYQGEHTW
jgi:hypothetical protein